MPHRTPLGRLAIALIASTIALAGCSNDTGSSSSKAAPGNNTGTTTAASDNPFANLKHIDAPNPCVLDPGVTATEIKIGGIVPESGAQAASFKPAEDGAKARFAKANSEGELGARKVTFVPHDDASDATRNAEAARQLVESDKVFAVLEASDKAAGSAQYLNDQKIPVTGWHVGVPAWAQHPNMFTFRQAASATPQAEYTDRTVQLLHKLGGSKVALVAGVNQSSVSYVERIEKTFKGTDLSVAYKSIDTQPGNTEFTAIVQRIKESGADTLITGMDFLQNTALSDQLTRAGVHMKITVFPGGYDPRVVKLPGIEGATFGLEFKPFESTPKPPAFVEFDKWLPKDTVRNQVSYIGWLAGEMMVQGIKEAGVACPTRAAFINNLRMVKGYSANGAFDPIDLADGWGHEFKCVYYVKVVNGAFVPQFDGQPFCGEPVKL
jgi:ABC-type branched-subunit amino acid transport system substrate-binding protein